MSKVSIIITTYNRPGLLGTAIKSALIQTYPKIEVIVVDGSFDNKTAEVISSFKNKISVVKDKKNIGVSAARNMGIKASSGEYITFLDDDDFFHPRKIEREIELFNSDGEIGLVYCPLGIKISDKLFYKPFTKEKNRWIGLSHLNPIILTPLIKKECFSDCGGFDESLSYHEEKDLWYRFGKKFRFEFNNNPDYIFYNLNIERLSTQLEKMCNNKKKLYVKHKHDFDDKDLYFSEMHRELAYTYLLFKDYRHFFKHSKKAIGKKPRNLPLNLERYLKAALERIDLYTKFTYKIEKIDTEIEQIFC